MGDGRAGERRADVDRRYGVPSPFTERFSSEIARVNAFSKQTIISKKNVFRSSADADHEVRDEINAMIASVLESGSGLHCLEHLAQLYEYSQRGHSCLILMEHYSNFDFPGLIYLLESHSEPGRVIGSHIIPMAAMKLNEEHPVLSSLTDAYTHISIFPARRIDELNVAAHDNSELKKAREINLAALKSMRSLSHNGHIILMFPSGTRYKPDDPQTKRVLKAADSFMKRFDYVLFGGIAGNTLVTNDPQNMMSDYVKNDILIYSFSQVYACKAFRKQVKSAIGDSEHLDQFVVERIEEELELAHQGAQQAYDKALNAQ